MPETFKENYPFRYEWFASFDPRTYEIAAQFLTTLDKNKQNNATILEIGCGTGISTSVLTQSNPNLKILVGIDPSRDPFKEFIDLAAYKFDRSPLKLPTGIPQEAYTYIAEQKERVSSLKDRVAFVQGISTALPIASNTFDRVYCNESLHWFAFATATSKPDHRLVEQSFNEIGRVLRNDGKLLFESNGYIFSFGNKKFEGLRLDDIHTGKHPLRIKFTQYFNQVILESGLQIDQENKKPDYLHYLFNLRRLKNLLLQSALELVEKNGEPYKLKIIKTDTDRTIQSIRTAARMEHFSRPGLINLPEEQKNSIVELALARTLDNYQDDKEKTFYETFVGFVAQKKAA